MFDQCQCTGCPACTAGERARNPKLPQDLQRICGQAGLDALGREKGLCSWCRRRWM